MQQFFFFYKKFAYFKLSASHGVYLQSNFLLNIKLHNISVDVHQTLQYNIKMYIYLTFLTYGRLPIGHLLKEMAKKFK